MWRARAFVACVVYSVISIVLHAYVVSVLSLHLLFFFFFLRLLFYSFFFLFFLCPVSFRFVFFHTHAEPRETRRDENNHRRNHAWRETRYPKFFLSLSLSIILISIIWSYYLHSFRVIKNYSSNIIRFLFCLLFCQLVVLVVVLFTVHCKMDSSPIVTTHTNNKSKSSRKSQ